MHRSQDEVIELIKSHDLVISLLPYNLHPEVAKLCVQYKTNMVTASYRSPAMFDLHQAAEDAGITIMNEVGVDPGIDHLLAMECFDNIKDHGGKVTSFVSYCGGLTAPEFSSNPLRYKFSWSPRGVLLNVLSGARFLQNGKVVDIPAGGQLLDSAVNLDFLPGFNLEGFANRDSTIYSELYGIESAHTILRGTLRFKGFSEAMKGLVKLGLISEQTSPILHHSGPDLTWREYMCDLMGKDKNVFPDTLKDLIYDKVGKDRSRLKCIEDLGLLEDEQIDKKDTPLDTLSNYLSKKLAFGPGERDLIVMRHDVGVKWSDNSEESHHIDLVVYGDANKYSAMAATVGFPTGIAAKMVLDGEIQKRGSILPFTPDVYRPMLSRLKNENIIAREEVRQVTAAPNMVPEQTRY
jgi:alpha-aminoadipic semialdehyde synthase